MLLTLAGVDQLLKIDAYDGHCRVAAVLLQIDALAVRVQPERVTPTIAETRKPMSSSSRKPNSFNSRIPAAVPLMCPLLISTSPTVPIAVEISCGSAKSRRTPLTYVAPSGTTYEYVRETY